jgi:hypothetical protein
MNPRASLTLLSALLLVSPAFACSVEKVEPLKEVSFQDGIGGSCYYKRIPPDSSNQPWRTEFYLTQEAPQPFYTLEVWFNYPVFCIGEENAKHIAHVQNMDGVGYPDVNDTSWLSFYVDNQLVQSYSPLDIIQDKNNIENTMNCGLEYLAQDLGFVFDEKLEQYVYQVETSDKRTVSFDPLTGTILETP